MEERISLKQLKEDFEYPDANVVDFNEAQLFVKQYLPAEQKYGLISGTIYLLGLEEGPFNPFLSEVVFENELVKAYSNVSFEDFNENVFKTHDILNISGLIDTVIKNIPVEEYEALCQLYEDAIEERIKYNHSSISLLMTASAVILEFFKAGEEIENFDISKYEAVEGILKRLGEQKHI